MAVPTDSRVVTGYSLQQLKLMGDRYRAAEALIHHIDTCKVLATVGRLTAHDGLAMTEAVENYKHATRMCGV